MAECKKHAKGKPGSWHHPCMPRALVHDVHGKESWHGSCKRMSKCLNGHLARVLPVWPRPHYAMRH